jgi:16S rRNA (guanine(966)-N(2))-methyltransferase RsmD
MRIVAGKARGLKLNTIEEYSTRPTKDMVKEALFSMLQDYVVDSIFLDLFAGSGSLGIEALSNGAKSCYFVEKHTNQYILFLD